MFVAVAIGLIGVIFVARTDAGIFNQMPVIGLNASFLAAMVFVTVRALTSAEPPEKIGFNFCFIGTLISNVLTLASYTRTELSFLICTGLLANISQIFMSNAYKIAPPGQIGPMNYIAIIFCRHLGLYILAGNTGSIEFDGFCIGS